jgi:hypothetical protein
MNNKEEDLPGGRPCPVKPYTTKELAGLYEISPRVFLKWIKPFKNRIGKRNGWFYNLLQVERIFAALGTPKQDTDD